MRTLRCLGSCSLLLAAIAAACAQSGSAPLPASDVEAIRAASKAYTQAASEKAWSNWATFFTEDAIFLPPNTTAKNGRAEIEAWARGFPPIRDLRIEPIEIGGRGDLAYVRGRYSFVMTISNQPEQPDSGKYIEIWRKQSDGSWKLFRDTFNSDVPLPSAQNRFAGTRQLNVNASKFMSGPALKSSVVQVEYLGETRRSIVDAVTAEGQKVRTEYSAPADGKDYPIMGSPDADTVSL